MSIPKTAFRLYDIRGKYPLEITRDDVFKLGKAFGTYLSSRNCINIVVGRDNRPNAPSISSVLIDGIVSTGAKVTFTGITTQPAMHYFTYLGYDAAINVTASHNPKEYTGFKIDYKNARPLSGDELSKVYDVYISGNYKTGEGSCDDKDLNALYSSMLTAKFKISNGIKVLLDCGGGATSVFSTEVLRKIGASVNDTFCNISCGSILEIPDPESALLMQEVGTLVRDSKSDVGIAFDGDGDRIGVTDEHGNLIRSDILLLLFASRLLARRPGSAVLYDVKSSEILNTEIARMGGNPKMLATGRSHFLEEMLEKKALLAAEFSGHFFFGDTYYGYDDGLYTACRLLDLLDKEQKPLSKLIDRFPKMISTQELKLECPDERKFGVISKLVESVRNNKAYMRTTFIDGVRVSFSQTGWFLIRASNTAPSLSIRVEGVNETDVTKGLQEAARLLSGFDFLNLSGLV